MNDLVGSVDQRGRPVVRVRIPGQDDEVLFIVDTAFTGELLLSEMDARSMGVSILAVEATIELGDRSTMTAKQGLVSIDWLGRTVDVAVQVTPSPATHRARIDGEPIGLLGTALLRACRVSIDLPDSTISIATVA